MSKMNGLPMEAGSNTKKLFDYNYSGAFISQLAGMIWICSDAELDDITKKLEEAEEEWQRVKERCENEQ